MSSDAKAAEYMAQGHKTLKKTSFFSFGGGSQKFEDASDLFEKAGNQFKISRKCALPRIHEPSLGDTCGGGGGLISAWWCDTNVFIGGGACMIYRARGGGRVREMR